MVSLDGRVFVVAGGAGVAGEAVASGLLRHGADVAVTSRSRTRLAAVREQLESARLHCVECGRFDLATAEAVRDEVTAKLGRIDGVVAALGGWWEGPPLTQIDPAIWHQIVADNLTSHFIAARAFLPALVGHPDAVYVTLAGVGAALPLPHAGPVSVTGVAQTRLLECLAAEQTGVRLHEVRIMTPIVTRHWDRADREPDWLTGEQVGDYVARVVSDGFPDPDRLVLPLPGP